MAIFSPCGYPLYKSGGKIVTQRDALGTFSKAENLSLLCLCDEGDGNGVFTFYIIFYIISFL
jgi:hypothetical protein